MDSKVQADNLVLAETGRYDWGGHRWAWLSHCPGEDYLRVSEDGYLPMWFAWDKTLYPHPVDALLAIAQDNGWSVRSVVRDMVVGSIEEVRNV